MKSPTGHLTHPVRIAAAPVTLSGDWCVPPRAPGIVLFAHGSGSSRNSPRNQAVARVLHAAGMGTLLFDLLTRDEEAEDAVDAHLRFDIGLLAHRLVLATHWVTRQSAATAPAHRLFRGEYRRRRRVVRCGSDEARDRFRGVARRTT